MDEIAREALRRHEAHVDHPTHRPLSSGYELVGLRGEEAWVQMFGGEVDLTRRDGGDGGTDHVILIPFAVDVKCARKAFNLIVEQGKVKTNTIYVLARYDDETDRATLLGWEWGSVLLKAPTRDFGYGVINHFIPQDRLRKIEELLHRARGNS